MIPAVALGLVVGIALGLIGGGGSIIAVPALVYGVGMEPGDAIPTSLLVVGLSSLAAVLPRFSSGINWRIALIVGTAGVPAAWAGTALGRLLDPNVLMLAFSALMIAVGIRMLQNTAESSGPCSPNGDPAWKSCILRALAVGILVGVLTGLLGVGGGFLIIPALTLLLGIPMRQAVGTSLVIIVLNSTAGLWAHASGFTIDWPIALAFSGAAVLGSFAASRLSHRLDDRLVNIVFAVVIFVVAAGVAVGTIVDISGA
ncbi:sulfite exporter TauE/SafE family protein [Arthrobacter sp. HLT1-21]